MWLRRALPGAVGPAWGAAVTMMPGETPPPPAGTAAAACANCGVLQQVATGRRPCGARAPGGEFLLKDATVGLRRAAGGWAALGAVVTVPGAAGTWIASVSNGLCKRSSNGKL